MAQGLGSDDLVGGNVRPALDGNSPIFQQVRAAIEADILSGALTPGGQIPSNRQLVALWGVNPVTILKGVGQLVDEGVLYKKRGEGMFVASDAPERLRKRIGASFRVEHVEPIVRLAVALGIGLDGLHAQIAEVWKENHND